MSGMKKRWLGILLLLAALAGLAAACGEGAGREAARGAGGDGGTETEEATPALGVGGGRGVPDSPAATGTTAAGPPPGCPPESLRNPVSPDETPVPGATPDICRPGWFEPYERMALAYPPFRGVLAGIRFVDPEEAAAYVRYPVSRCQGYRSTSADEAKGSRVAVAPTYLPAGASRLSSQADWCSGQAVAVWAEYEVPALQEPLRFGGTLTIERYFVSEPVVSARERALPGRWYGTTVAGRAAAVARPLVPEVGFGDSAVYIYGEGVITIVRAMGLSERELLAVAEGLFPR